MKVTNKVTIELTVEEAEQLAKTLSNYDFNEFEYELMKQLCDSIGIKTWEV